MPLDDPLIQEYLTLLLYGSPFILMMGKVFFGSWAGFVECVRFLVMPDLVSLLRGEWGEDQWATMKLLVFLAFCVFALYSAHRHFYG